MTAKQADNRRNTPGLHRYAKGLYLQVTPKRGAGAEPDDLARSWLLRFVSPITGKPRGMGLGSYEDVPFAAAVQEAKRWRTVLAAKRDPLIERDNTVAAERAAEAKRRTFAEAADEYLKSLVGAHKNAKHAAQWTRSLTVESKAIGGVDVNALTAIEIAECLRQSWKDTRETARRTLGRIITVVDYAKAQGYRTESAIAAKEVRTLLSKEKQVRGHHAAMPYNDVPALMDELAAKPFASAFALRFTILTAARTAETIGARWSEINWRQKLWTVPGERMKGGKDHVVPLSDAALGILQDVPTEGDRHKGNGYIFPGRKAGEPLSNMAMAELLKDLRLDIAATVHGMRSSFTDWATERTNFDRLMVEFAKAHKLPDKVEAAYLRSTMREKRRELMEAWATFKPLPQDTGDNVVAIGGRA